MGTAVKGLTHLHLTVRLILHNQHRLTSPVDTIYTDGSRSSCSGNGTTVGGYKEGWNSFYTEVHGNAVGVGNLSCCPLHLVDVPRAVFKIISSAVPGLQHLSLLGFCSDAALKKFGFHCEELTSLTVDLSSVSTEALRKLHAKLPNLKYLTVMRRGKQGNNLQAGVESVFAALRKYTSFTHLNLDFGSRVWLSCNESAGALLPRGMLELRCSGLVVGLSQATSMFQTLQRLDVVGSPCTNLVQLLRLAPCLKALAVKNTQPIVIDTTQLCKEDSSPLHDQAVLLLRLQTMELSCPCLVVRAFSVEVCELLSWLKPIPAAQSLTIELRSPSAAHTHFLQQVARVVPNMSTLKLADADPSLSPSMIVSDLNESFLAPLMECLSLKKLFLHIHIALSMPGLLQLCLGLPALETVKCFASEGLDCNELEKTICQQNPHFQLTQLNEVMM